MAEALGAVSLVPPSPSTFLAAAQLRPLTLRSLDALHLAAALELGNDLPGVFSYTRMIAGARTASIGVVTPR